MEPMQTVSNCKYIINIGNDLNVVVSSPWRLTHYFLLVWWGGYLFMKWVDGIKYHSFSLVNTFFKKMLKYAVFKFQMRGSWMNIRPLSLIRDDGRYITISHTHTFWIIIPVGGVGKCLFQYDDLHIFRRLPIWPKTKLGWWRCDELMTCCLDFFTCLSVSFNGGLSLNFDLFVLLITDEPVGNEIWVWWQTVRYKDLNTFTHGAHVKSTWRLWNDDFTFSPFTHLTRNWNGDAVMIWSDETYCAERFSMLA